MLHLLYRDSYMMRYQHSEASPVSSFHRVGVLAPAMNFAFGGRVRPLCSAAVVRELPLVRAVTCHPNSIVGTFVNASVRSP
jgi:hypothetical protein